ncbi:MAG: hypothetical protein PQJ61_06850 [Spirochaetales bacterium]|uniref:Uncharacterized protein n=1 Tax=Candidatus Thalassospirochaeta sargassi TaxID=3119039 RepID=A0AAJ1IFU2_9SPIO|nr:hypothetical protein [Spirochaetales bacterium]
MSDNQNNKNNVFSGEVDPEIADLFGIEENDGPSFDLLFEEGQSDKKNDHPKETIDLNKKRFEPVDKFFETKPAPYFKNKSYYQQALGGEGEESQHFHKILSQYLNIEDPKQRSAMRSKLISAYWELAESMAKKIHTGLPDPKLLSLRYGAVLPNLLSAETRNLLARVIKDNNTNEPVHYIDEWLLKISTGSITASTTDEIKPSKLKSSENIRPQIEKQEGQKQAFISLIQRKQANIVDYENSLIENMKTLSTRENHPEYNNINLTYSDTHRKAIYNISQSLKNLQKIDKEISSLFNDLEKTEKLLTQLHEKAERLGEVMHVDTSIIVKEFGSLRQMAKMCVGRQGNHIPVLMKQYFNADDRNIGTRENLICEVSKVEEIDPGLFLRTFKRETNRIVPYFILIPCYGERGICWEPFEKYNRGTSRGRVAIPMYSKNLKLAVITALADLRWQVAKEKAQHYWMEEGLTGHYYQWFSDHHLKGDVRERFINDYTLWIMKESEGTQKLEREVRGVFWRDIPFPDEIRDKLKNRGFVYNELYKKDINRAMSDGY